MKNYKLILLIVILALPIASATDALCYDYFNSDTSTNYTKNAGLTLNITNNKAHIKGDGGWDNHETPLFF